MTSLAGSSVEGLLEGIVVAVQANYYWVKFDSAMGSGDLPPLLCTCRSRLQKVGQRVMVGDRVCVEEPDWESCRGAIFQVAPRGSELDRPPMANANQILLVFALAKPALDVTQLSRFLVKAESTGIEVCLCLSKSDLVPTPHREAWRDRLRKWGYDPVFISAYTLLGIDEVTQRLAGRVTVVSGPSGVGKSSLINALIPDVKIRTSAVSGKLERGRHTTRHVELFELPGGGLLADTPGFNQPDLNATPTEVMQFFPEVRSRMAKKSCQFGNCLHLDEPKCKVRGSWERYELYCTFVEEAKAWNSLLANQSNTETVMKQKSQAKGEVTYEPKLKSKYRAESRRHQQQAVQVIKGKVEDWENEEN
jgi:ribosome biogenesis GTPase / thiamine phosphate phosphatase